MVYDFVMDLGAVDLDEPVFGNMMNECAFFLGIDDLYSYPSSRRKLEIVEKNIANRRLTPLVMGMFNQLWSNHSDYSWKSRRSIKMTMSYYGIGGRSMSLAKVAEVFNTNQSSVHRMISMRVERISKSSRYAPWCYLYVAALYLPTIEYRRFCAALRKKDSDLRRYKDLKSIYKCLNAK